jgi:hypothetical protein
VAIVVLLGFTIPFIESLRPIREIARPDYTIYHTKCVLPWPHCANLHNWCVPRP